jgi:hypothetical protein
MHGDCPTPTRPRVLNRFGGRWAEMRRKPGTDTKFPAQFAGNWLSVPGFAPRDMLPVRRAPKTVKHHAAHPFTAQATPETERGPESAS